MGTSFPAVVLVLALVLLSPPPAQADAPSQSTYIVHVSPSQKPASSPTHVHWYLRTLRSLRRPEQSSPRPKLLHAYSLAASGFAASLTAEDAASLRRLPYVLDVVRDRVHQLDTTRSPAFLHLSDSSGLWPVTNFSSDVVVGVLDSGIFPSLPSFVDDALLPVPSSWKGYCQSVPGFNASLACNRKLIGARFFYEGYEATMGRPINEFQESKSPLDTDGHGTHTASTAAGAAVADASYFSYASGEARGMATNARIAAYKVCWKSGCSDADILAGMDTAIADGVDVISISISSSDSIYIGALRAARRGVVVSCSAGNTGPDPSTVGNLAPWILTVGASTIDREFPADVRLGDGNVYRGASLPSKPLNSTVLFPLVDAEDCGSKVCINGSLDPNKVAGKIVLCDRGVNTRVEKGSAVKLAGGVGMIMANNVKFGEELLADPHVIPAIMVVHSVGDEIRSYIKSERSPNATIDFKGSVIGEPDSPPAPRVAAFSGRGPNSKMPEILKPDVIAPGVNILAAWTGANSPTGLDIDTRTVVFNIMSGTSMACPHVSGIAAMLRKAHPKWSPAAIKSALMTTAYNEDNSGQTIIDLATGNSSTPFARGAGHVDPNKALDPGLVYDMSMNDYLAFLCAIGYGPDKIAVFTSDETTVDCSAVASNGAGDVNYPSFAVVFSSGRNVVTYKRVVRNVGGPANAVYEAEISAPAGVNVAVNPSKLEFDAVEQSLAYEITFDASAATGAAAAGSHAFGSILWRDGTHVVRSPIAVTWTQNSLVSAI